MKEEKSYDKVKRLQVELNWMGYKKQRRLNDVKNLEHDLTELIKHHRVVEQATRDAIEHAQIDLDNLDEYVKDLRSKIQKLTKKEKKPSIATKPVTPKVNGNGKVECTLCKKEFSKQGIKSHMIACKKKQLEEELALLNLQGD